MRDVHEAELHEVTEFCEAKLFDVDCGVFTSAVHCPRELGTLRGAKSLNPMNLRRIIPTEEASHFPKLIVIFWELLRRFGNFSGRRFSFFKNNLFEKGKC